MVKRPKMNSQWKTQEPLNYFLCFISTVLMVVIKTKGSRIQGVKGSRVNRKKTIFNGFVRSLQPFHPALAAIPNYLKTLITYRPAFNCLVP
jgi:hypothetical protein